MCRTEAAKLTFNPQGTVTPNTLYNTDPTKSNLGTITIGRRVSDEIAEQLRQTTGNEITYFTSRQLAASSWPAPARTGLLCAVQSAPPATTAKDGARSFSMTLAGQRLMGLLIPVAGENGARGLLLIQGDLDTALQPYTNIQRALVVIGVHAPEFAFEKDLGNVRKAVADLGIHYPVAVDNDYALWRAFGSPAYSRRTALPVTPEAAAGSLASRA